MILCLGELIAFWLNYGFNYLTTDDWWRIPLAIQVIPAAVLALGCWYWVPPSPRWLVQEDRLDCALEVLTQFHGSEAANLEIQEIRDSVTFEKVVSQASWLDMFKPPVLRVTFLGMMIQFFQQITGTNSILYYTVRKISLSLVSSISSNYRPMKLALTLRTRRHHQPQDFQPRHRRRRLRPLRLRLDPHLLL